MRISRAALVAACSLCCAAAATQSPTLTLPEAMARVSESHPDLVRLAYAREAAGADAEEANFRPPLTIGAELENAFGSGSFSEVDRAEMTLSLASVIELSGKRDARRELAEARLLGLTSSETATRLDVLAEVARRYLDALGAQTMLGIADANIAQRERTAEMAARRVQAGASPESTRLAAEAALARARLDRGRALTGLQAAQRRLAILWKDRTPLFDRVDGDALRLPQVPPLESLVALLDHNPQLRVFADEKRIREARLQLARSASTPDLQWHVGARRLEETRDWAAVAGFSMPLGTRTRAEPAIRSAQAELSSLTLEHESAELALYATLADAHARFSAASQEVNAARDDLLPRLARAEAAAERAYRGGALSYLEWSQVQADGIESQRRQIEAAIEGHRALIEIQRLTGDSFLVKAPNSAETRP